MFFCCPNPNILEWKRLLVITVLGQQAWSGKPSHRAVLTRSLYWSNDCSQVCGIWTYGKNLGPNHSIFGSYSGIIFHAPQSNFLNILYFMKFSFFWEAIINHFNTRQLISTQSKSGNNGKRNNTEEENFSSISDFYHPLLIASWKWRHHVFWRVGPKIVYYILLALIILYG